MSCRLQGEPRRGVWLGAGIQAAVAVKIAIEETTVVLACGDWEAGAPFPLQVATKILNPFSIYFHTLIGVSKHTDSPP